MNAGDLLRRAVALHQGGDLGAAEALYRDVLRLAPESFDARHLLGVLHAQQGRPAEARTQIERALTIRPGDAAALANFGKVQMALGDFAGALAAYDGALAARPASPDLLYARANALREMGRLADAEQGYHAATQARPDFADAFSNRGAVLQSLGRTDEALVCFDRATSAAPAHADAWNNRAALLSALNRFAEAADAAGRAIAARPGFAEAFNNRGSALWRLDRTDAALADFNQALAIRPDFPGALANRAKLLWSEIGDPALAQRDLVHLLNLDPDFALARGDLFYVRAQTADWRNFDEDVAALTQAIEDGKPAVQPFIFQACSASPAALYACARLHAAREYPAPVGLLAPLAHTSAKTKIRLGYVCGEFRGHATSYLTAGLFESHDRAAFEVIAFDNGKADDSPTRRRLEQAFDRMIPIHDLGDREAAERIRAEEIDILINLNGYYGAHRMGVFAHRPAPVQVNYLGFPGTLGAPYIDYILADPTVLPQGEQHFHAEQVVWLPDSYQVNDNRRAIAGSAPSRAEAGLPDSAFIFCNFNQPYKLSPAMLQTWLRILAQVPGSVLWLWANNDAFGANVKAFAARHGIDDARIVIAQPAPVEDHLARLTLAELFLDSLPYNAHTTASDALWAGVPLLTCTGTAFAGRVATSLLRCANLPELITTSLQQYEDRAVALARDPQDLRALRERLAANRATCPLFDTARSCRHIESAYRGMWERWRAGLAPSSFAVAAQAP